MSKYLSFYGGDRAVSIIKERGLTQDIIKVVAGAAGGPKWLILGAMDRFLFSEWFTKRRTVPDPLFLIGSSAGAWRFVAASHNDPAEALEKFKESYINQWYSVKPTSEEINLECQKVLNRFLDDNSVIEILNHPYCRTNFFSVRSKGIADSDNVFTLSSHITFAALFNLFNRKYINHFFTRTLFYNPLEIPPFYNIDEFDGKNSFPMLKIPLTKDNFKKALLSSGSIPLVMQGVKDIPEAPNGVYRDGGTIDYHIDLPLLEQFPNKIRGFDKNSEQITANNSYNQIKSYKDQIVLFPHYTNRIIPGWLDKHIPWRKPDPDNFRDVLLITPTKKFTDMLPGGKIPERQDFQTFKGKNRERIERWKTALKYSEILGDELCRIFYSGNVINIIEPIEKII